MKELPFKFMLVMSKLEHQYRWHRFYERADDEKPGARFGTLIDPAHKTYRIDLEYSFFKSSCHHWINSHARELISEKFQQKVTKLRQGSVIVMLWSDNLFWLDNERSKLNMEVWSGEPSEPRALWAGILSG